MIDPGFDIGDRVGLEFVQERQLGRFAIGDRFDFVLGVDVRAEDHTGFERDVRRLPIDGQYDRFVAGGATDNVLHSIFGFDRDFDASPGEILLHQGFNTPAFGRLFFAAWKSVQGVADKLEHRRFAGTACTDKAIQAVGQFELGSIEESPDDRDAPDPVRVEAVIHGYPCNRYKQKSRRLLAFSGGAVTPLVTPRRKMGKLWIYFPHAWKCSRAADADTF